MEKVYVILYTHQKQKKAKTWHDGVLKHSGHGMKAVLYDDKGSRLDSIHIKVTDIVVGEQLESDRYYILIEEVKVTGGNVKVTQVEQGQTQNQGVTNSQLRSQNSQVLSQARCAGLKRKKTGFNPPRLLKPSQEDSDSYPSPPSYTHPSFIQRENIPNASHNPSDLKLRDDRKKLKHENKYQMSNTTKGGMMDKKQPSNEFDYSLYKGREMLQGLDPDLRENYAQQNEKEMTTVNQVNQNMLNLYSSFSKGDNNVSSSQESGLSIADRLVTSPWSVYGSNNSSPVVGSSQTRSPELHHRTRETKKCANTENAARNIEKLPSSNHNSADSLRNQNNFPKESMKYTEEASFTHRNIDEPVSVTETNKTKRSMQEIMSLLRNKPNTESKAAQQHSVNTNNNRNIGSLFSKNAQQSYDIDIGPSLLTQLDKQANKEIAKNKTEQNERIQLPSNYQIRCMNQTKELIRKDDVKTDSSCISKLSSGTSLANTLLYKEGITENNATESEGDNETQGSEDLLGNKTIVSNNKPVNEAESLDLIDSCFSISFSPLSNTPESDDDIADVDDNDEDDRQLSKNMCSYNSEVLNPETKNTGEHMDNDKDPLPLLTDGTMNLSSENRDLTMIDSSPVNQCLMNKEQAVDVEVSNVKINSDSVPHGACKSVTQNDKEYVKDNDYQQVELELDTGNTADAKKKKDDNERTSHPSKEKIRIDESFERHQDSGDKGVAFNKTANASSISDQFYTDMDEIETEIVCDSEPVIENNNLFDNSEQIRETHTQSQELVANLNKVTESEHDFVGTAKDEIDNELMPDTESMNENNQLFDSSENSRITQTQSQDTMEFSCDTMYDDSQPIDHTFQDKGRNVQFGFSLITDTLDGEFITNQLEKKNENSEIGSVHDKQTPGQVKLPFVEGMENIISSAEPNQQKLLISQNRKDRDEKLNLLRRNEHLKMDGDILDSIDAEDSKNVKEVFRQKNEISDRKAIYHEPNSSISKKSFSCTPNYKNDEGCWNDSFTQKNLNEGKIYESIKIPDYNRPMPEPVEDFSRTKAEVVKLGMELDNLESEGHATENPLERLDLSPVGTLPHPSQLFGRGSRARMKNTDNAVDLWGREHVEEPTRPDNTQMNFPQTINSRLSGYRMSGSLCSKASRAQNTDEYQTGYQPHTTQTGPRYVLGANYPKYTENQSAGNCMAAENRTGNHSIQNDGHVEHSPFQRLSDSEMSGFSSPNLYVDWNSGKPQFVDRSNKQKKQFQQQNLHPDQDVVVPSRPDFKQDSSACEDEEIYTQLYRPRPMYVRETQNISSINTHIAHQHQQYQQQQHNYQYTESIDNLAEVPNIESQNKYESNINSEEVDSLFTSKSMNFNKTNIHSNPNEKQSTQNSDFENYISQGLDSSENSLESKHSEIRFKENFPFAADDNSKISTAVEGSMNLTSYEPKFSHWDSQSSGDYFVPMGRITTSKPIADLSTSEDEHHHFLPKKSFESTNVINNKSDMEGKLEANHNTNSQSDAINNSISDLESLTGEMEKASKWGQYIPSENSDDNDIDINSYAQTAVTLKKADFSVIEKPERMVTQFTQVLNATKMSTNNVDGPQAPKSSYEYTPVQFERTATYQKNESASLDGRQVSERNYNIPKMSDTIEFDTQREEIQNSSGKIPNSFSSMDSFEELLANDDFEMGECIEKTSTINNTSDMKDGFRHKTDMEDIKELENTDLNTDYEASNNCTEIGSFENAPKDESTSEAIHQVEDFTEKQRTSDISPIDNTSVISKLVLDANEIEITDKGIRNTSPVKHEMVYANSSEDHNQNEEILTNTSRNLQSKDDDSIYNSDLFSAEHIESQEMNFNPSESKDEKGDFSGMTNEQDDICDTKNSETRKSENGNIPNNNMFEISMNDSLNLSLSLDDSTSIGENAERVKNKLASSHSLRIGWRPPVKISESKKIEDHKNTNTEVLSQSKPIKPTFKCLKLLSKVKKQTENQEVSKITNMRSSQYKDVGNSSNCGNDMSSRSENKTPKWTFKSPLQSPNLHSQNTGSPVLEKSSEDFLKHKAFNINQRNITSSTNKEHVPPSQFKNYALRGNNNLHPNKILIEDVKHRRNSPNTLQVTSQSSNTVNKRFKAPTMTSSTPVVDRHVRSVVDKSISNTCRSAEASAKNVTASELRFPSKTEIETISCTERQVFIPYTFTSVAEYKTVLIQAMTEYINCQLYDVCKKYHHALSKVDITDCSTSYKGSSTAGRSGGGNTNPVCQCGVPSKMISVRKEGPNNGRYFYTCSSANRKQQCKYFQWADEQSKGGKSGGSVGAKRKVPNIQALSIYMKEQRLHFYGECQLNRRVKENIRPYFKAPKWARNRGDGDMIQKKQMFLKLPHKGHSSLYAKDDIWVVSQNVDFDPSSSFLARSAYYGPTSSLEVEIEPLVGYSPSNWPQDVMCHAILTGNASSELSCIENIREHLQHQSPPVVSSLMNRIGNEEKGSSSSYQAPRMIQRDSQQHLYIHSGQMEELVRGYIEQYRLNSDQTEAIRRMANMFCVEKTDTVDSVLLIHGVFGAGKSFLLSVIVLFLTKVFQMNDSLATTEPFPWKLLISSTTNVAVDRILIGLLELGFEDFVRVGSVKKIAKPVLPYSVHASGTDNQELKDLQEMLRSGELTNTEKSQVRQSIEKHRLGENKKKLGRVRVVGVTCASCSLACLNNMQFPLVLLDECSQMTEPASLLPIARFGCHKLLLVGDPKQLDPTIQGSDSTHSNGLEQTMFDRLINMGCIPSILRTQYRCHPYISDMANTLFYGGMLEDGVTQTDRQPLLDILPTLCFFDVPRGQECCERAGSFYNEGEAKFVVFLLQVLLASGLEPTAIGVITLYRSQMARILDLLSRGRDNIEMTGVQVSTVDAFQGGERDVIILSCVRTDACGFIDNDKRTNVALTRARHHLLIVGNLQNLSGNQLWGKVINHCRGHDQGIQSADEARHSLEQYMETFKSSGNSLVNKGHNSQSQNSTSSNHTNKGNNSNKTCRRKRKIPDNNIDSSEEYENSKTKNKRKVKRKRVGKENKCYVKEVEVECANEMDGYGAELDLNGNPEALFQEVLTVESNSSSAPMSLTGSAENSQILPSKIEFDLQSDDLEFVLSEGQTAAKGQRSRHADRLNPDLFNSDQELSDTEGLPVFKC